MNLIEQIKSLKWAILKSEYQKVFSDKSWYPNHPTQNAVGFSENYLGYPLQVYAYFVIDGNKDKLARVVAAFGNLTDEQLEELFRKLVVDLTEKYGEPQFSETSEDRLSEMKKWKTKDSIISADFMLSKSSALSEFNAFNISSGFSTAGPGIGITWGDIKNDPLSKSWDESGFSDENKPQKLPKDFKFSEAQIEEIKRSMEKE